MPHVLKANLSGLLYTRVRIDGLKVKSIIWLGWKVILAAAFKEISSKLREALEVYTTLLSADLVTVQTKCLRGKDNLK